MVDLTQMKVVKKLKTEAKPDGSAYATPFHKLYVSDERGRAEAVVDVQKDEIIHTLHFDSETGMPQYDPIARRVHVNLQDPNIFAVKKHASLRNVPILRNSRRNTCWVRSSASEVFLSIRKQRLYCKCLSLAECHIITQAL